MNAPAFPAALDAWIASFGDPLNGGWSRVEWARTPQQGLLARTLGLTLGSVFQPIFDHSGRLYGYEALLRASTRGRAVAPARAFAIATLQGELVNFDRQCRLMHLVNYLHAGGATTPLFLNVHPAHLLEINERHGHFFRHIREQFGAAGLPIVLEITEENISPQQLGHIRNAVRNYRQQGFLIAIDDFGAGSANIDRIWQLEPDFVKLDRQFIVRAEHDPRARRVLGKLIGLLHELAGQVVVEGIETALQQQLALDGGAHLLQGYWLGRPQGTLTATRPATAQHTTQNNTTTLSQSGANA
ncbi:EAL domain-containing protein [Chitinilyticum litopenaei]|uniref:EAL domain-containing protein n=1 Tax=Chitinilyticum litopenaei TaxID=1121276 RepID=UPI0004110249|nr:EAL domain-containing protein [Chitinilyticum litopenaei]